MLRDTLVDLRPHLERLAAALAHGPPSLLVQSTNDHQLLGHLLQVLVSSAADAEAATSWPQLVTVDCAEVREPKHLFDRVLNSLAKWETEYKRALGGCPNWDDRAEDALNMSAKRWRREVPPPSESAKGVLADHADSSLATFAVALEHLLDLLPAQHRYIVLLNSERLRLVADSSAADHTSSLLSGVIEAVEKLRHGRITLVAISAAPIILLAPQAVYEVPVIGKADLLRLLADGTVSSDGRASIGKSPLRPNRGAALAEAPGPSQIDVSSLQSMADQAHQVVARSIPPQDLPRCLSGMCEALWSTSTVATGRSSLPISAWKTQIADRAERLYMLADSRSAVTSSLSAALSLSAKAALLATYLACWNPSRTDVRLFATANEDRRPRAKRKKSAAAQDQILLGPKAAALDRIHAIWEVLVDQVEPPRTGLRRSRRRTSLLRRSDADFNMQMSTLISVNLVSRSGAEKLDQVKIKVAIEREEAGTLAKAVGLQLSDWLDAEL